MNRYRFEIVHRAFGRFGWNFVRIDDRGSRVLARSERSYRSRKRVRRAIAALEAAPIVDTTTDLSFRLPATGFRFVPGVVPLIVDESPVEEHDAFFTSSAVQIGRNERNDEGKAPAAHEAVAAVKAQRRRRKPDSKQGT